MATTRFVRCASALALASAIAAQRTPSPVEQLEQELTSTFLEQAPWTLDHETALAAARAREQIVFGYFTTAGP